MGFIAAIIGGIFLTIFIIMAIGFVFGTLASAVFSGE